MGKTDVRSLAEQIKILSEQLLNALNGEEYVAPQKAKKMESEQPLQKGAAGGISILIEDGFFDAPKDLASTMEKLKEIGRYYPRPTVAMNLLNLTKRRVFSRLKDKETNNWVYVVRK